MDWKNQLTKTPYLVLFIVLITVGVGTASALTITLGADLIEFLGILDMNFNRITNVGTPTVSTDAATKGYVDQASSTDTLASLGCTTDQIAKFVGPKMFVVGVVGDDVNEYTLTSPFDVSTASFVDSFSVAAQETNPRGLAFSSDGTKMFVIGLDGDDVNEYTLSTPFDVSTGIFVDSFSVGTQETSPHGLAFSSDGTKMFVVGSDADDVNEYTLSTPFDVSTASFVDSFSIAVQEVSPSGVAFSSDGTKMFVVGAAGVDVNEYTLSTPFDVSTASFVDSFSVAGQEASPQDVAFSSDGTKMFVVGVAGDDVNEYTLTTPFDVSTASFVDSFSVAAQETAPAGVAFSSGEGWACAPDDDTNHDGAFLPVGTALSCTSGQFVTGLTASGNVICGDPNP